MNNIHPFPVLHIITRLIVGGAQENTMYTAVMLNKERYKVDVISGPQTGSEGSLIEETIQRGASLTILPELVREINPWKDFLASWKLYRRMKTEHYLIVHTHSSKAGILGRFAARLAGVPIIVHTVHGWSFHDHMSRGLRRIYISLEKYAASISDIMVVVTKNDITKGIEEGIGQTDQYRLIRSSIPIDEFDPGIFDRSLVRKELDIPQDVPVLGNIGRFSPQKNPLDWIRVADNVAKELPDCFFLLVGDGPLRTEVEELISTTNLAKRTIITGLRRDIPRMLSTIDVFLLTSLWEGLPRVIPQAMSMGIPVIANRADGTIEAVQDGITGYLCSPGDINGLARNCIRLLSDKKIRYKMGLSCQNYARREYNLDVMITQIESLYEELIENKYPLGYNLLPT